MSTSTAAAAATATANPYAAYKTIKISYINPQVLHVELNRTKKLNAMNQQNWTEIGKCFSQIALDTEVRAVILSGGASKIFTSGLDLMDAASIFAVDKGDVSRNAFFMRQFIRDFQNAFTAIERCPQPVISAIHGACIGGGVDLVCSTCIRVCTQDASFCIKEVDVGLAADVGTLQRASKIVGNHSLLREWSYTARNITSSEALSAGLVSKIYANKEEMMEGAIKMANLIASKSPVAVVGTKHNLIYARDHSVEEGLEYIATWNMAMLQSKDLTESVQAAMEKRKPIYSKL